MKWRRNTNSEINKKRKRKKKVHEGGCNEEVEGEMKGKEKRGISIINK